VSWRDWLRGKPPEGDDELRECSFCDRALPEVFKLIQGPEAIHICDRCIAEASELIRHADRGRPIDPTECSFCRQLANIHFERYGHRICDPCVALTVEVLVEAELPVARVVSRDRPRS
jgi:hypothetical protein